ncbi:unnamed protein product [Thelazia callipaeda]|uniref:O-methyltransferase n=1 Tax=Thelazia callipaeda TaxID=103827 RepID=A0A0N5D860_THECL|nr:unnamed protein product [Thelazia callipaeda]
MNQTITNLPNAVMLASPEVLQLGQNLILLIQATKAIDIGTFTGSSAVAWALAMPEGSKVLTIDIYPDYYDNISQAIVETRPDIHKKIQRHIGPALLKLGQYNFCINKMLISGEAEKWDFVFIDADKTNYPNYYDQAVKLLRPGGVIVIDNALWGGRVAYDYVVSNTTAAINETNHKASTDSRVSNFLLPVGDGTHVIFKLYNNNNITTNV